MAADRTPSLESLPAPDEVQVLRSALSRLDDLPPASCPTLETSKRIIVKCIEEIEALHDDTKFLRG